MWSIDGRRLLREADAVAAAGLPLKLINHPVLGPVWAAVLRHAGGESQVEVIYPWFFPLAPPALREFDPTTGKLRGQHRTGHQLPDGSLCLFTMGLGAESWRPEYTVVDVIKAWHAFKRLQHQGTLSTQRFSRDEQVAVNAGLPAYMPASLAEAMRRSEGSGEVSWCQHHAVWVAQGATRKGQEALPMAAEGWDVLESPDAALGWIETPWCFFRGDVERLFEAPAHFKRVLSTRLSKTQQEAVMSQQTEVLVVGPKAAHLAKVMEESGVRRIDARPVVEGTLDQAIFARTEGLMPARPGLAERLVVMVGLGSLGSHIALALARAGVQNFHLYDPDVLVPENLSRHIGYLHDVGRPKVDVVADQIRACQPAAEVIPVQGSPLPDMTAGGFGGMVTFTIDYLLNPNALFIVSVANHHVENALNGLLVQRDVPALYASVIGPGDHGRVVRVVPGETGCLECLRHAQAAGRAVSLGWEAQGDAYHPPGMPGLGVDVQQVALLTARLALQTLSRGLQGGLADEPANHLVWTNRGGDPFDRPLQLITERVAPEPGCHTCRPRAELSDQEQARLRALLSAG